MDINGKTCVLTGATGGIGAAFAAALASAGARLLLVGRNIEQLGRLLEELPGEGHTAVQADLATEAGRVAVVEAAAGGVDLLINNAGVNHFGMLQHQSEDQLRQMMELNIIVPMLLTQALLPLLIRSEGRIVCVGSGFGSIGFAGYCGYSASKFALRGFSEALRRELSDTPVKVLYLAPRATDTDMNPAAVVALNQQLGNATDSPLRVAEELMALLHKDQNNRFIGWPERFFIKLNALLPRVVDSALAKQLPVIQRQALAARSQAG